MGPTGLWALTPLSVLWRVHLKYVTVPFPAIKKNIKLFRDGGEDGFAAACHVPHHRRMEFCADSPSIVDITSDLCGGQQHNARAAQSTAPSLLEHDHDDARR